MSSPPLVDYLAGSGCFRQKLAKAWNIYVCCRAWLSRIIYKSTFALFHLLFKFNFKCFIYVYVGVAMSTGTWDLRRPGALNPWSWSCDPPSVEAGRQTQVLYKKRAFSTTEPSRQPYLLFLLTCQRSGSRDKHVKPVSLLNSNRSWETLGTRKSSD